MLLKTDNGRYVHELRGVCFVTWVSEKDKEYAYDFPLEIVGEMGTLIEKWQARIVRAVEREMEIAK